ncbi:MAG: acyltransferase family protein [Roseburia intestinalis]|jgi:hypothetical protein
MGKRLKYIDIVKFLGIFLLFIEHTGNWTELGGKYNYLKIWICSFHMPLFFIIYGMVVSPKYLNGFKEWKSFFYKKVKSLLIPYLIWGMIYTHSIDTNFFKGMAYATNPSLGYAQTNQVLWFLPVMFISTILHQIIMQFKNKKSNGWVMFIVFAVICGFLSLILKNIRGDWGIFWGIDIALTGEIFILIGYLLKHPMEILYQKKRTVIVIVLVACICVGTYLAQTNPPTECWVTIMALAYYGKSYILFLFTAVLNTIGICCLAILLEKVTILVWMGEGSLFLMAVHYIIFPYTISLSTQLVYNSIGIALLNAVLCTIVCIPALFFINYYIPILKGK